MWDDRLTNFLFRHRLQRRVHGANFGEDNEIFMCILSSILVGIGPVLLMCIFYATNGSITSERARNGSACWFFRVCNFSSTHEPGAFPIVQSANAFRALALQATKSRWLGSLFMW